ncbi:MAG: hypothetical protein JKY84_08515 [Emcibacteraceae bacterium]|nr:hypothetical protein [Emcibacteraceae bacterium]
MKITDNIHLNGNRKVWASLILAIFMLAGIEAALQARVYLNGGAVADELVDDGSIYFYNEEFQLKLIQPNIISDEGYRTVQSNSYGLRSPEIALEKEEDEVRIAILGASSVMGMLNPVNEETITYRLEEHLQAQFPNKKVNVINGGIAGYEFADQKQLFDKVLAPFELDLLVLYTGFNDVTPYCLDGGVAAESNGLVNYELPDWVISIEILIKNSAILRELRPEVEKTTDPSSLNVIPFRERYDDLVGAISNANVPILVATNPRSYSRNMPYQQQHDLSELSRSKDTCFSIMGLHDVYDRHNDIIAEMSKEYGASVIRLDQLVPNGEDFYGDSIHFNARGSEYVAQLLLKKITESNLIGDGGLN